MATMKSKTLKSAQERRMTNEQIISRARSLEAEIIKERKIRTNPEDVRDRENAFQLDGLIKQLGQLIFNFEHFVNPPRAK